MNTTTEKSSHHWMQKKGTLSIATLKFDHVVWFYHGMCPVMTNYNNPELVLSKPESPNLIFCRLEISHIFSRLDIQRQQYSCTITTQIINKQTLSSRFILCRCSYTKYNYSRSSTNKYYPPWAARNWVNGLYNVVDTIWDEPLYRESMTSSKQTYILYSGE